jgi:serine/threonine protein kinase
VPTDNIARQREIFEAALDIADDAERDAMIDHVCADDPQLRARITELVAAHAEAETFFSECADAIALSAEDFLSPASAEAIASETIDEAVGSTIGPYELLRKLGEGGCGAVYMAEQQEPVHRRVALKVIKLGMDTKSVIARFGAERHALALMDHPSIARVLDAGATDSGRPYFVMELVQGEKITDFCDTNRLDMRQRLELFAQVCRAIQHAHQKGVIHRDIKPSNVLVHWHEGAPLPKVIDFGIAKAAASGLTSDVVTTTFSQFLGTPAYMSPEQAQMSVMDVDTRSDIYSLGVLLYELLTGKTPFDQKELLSSGIDEMRHTLRERDPLRPSTRMDALSDEELNTTAQQRRLEPQKLRSDLRGDLDWIVMKALEKDRNRRYQTANGVAADVQRYLDNEPIAARPPTQFYLLQKMVRRNKIAFVAGTAVAVALVSGFGFSTCMYFRESAARKEQVRLRQLADRALANEAALHREGEARTKITEAAVLLNRRRFEEADELVSKLSLPVVQPSLEAADVFRRLAIWNVNEGNWKAAAARLLKLVEANQIDKTDMSMSATQELLFVGPVLVLIGDNDGYERFRQAIINRFSETKYPLASEQILRASTLTPLDEKTSHALEPLASNVEKSITAAFHGPGYGDYSLAWRAFAMTGFEFQRGNYSNAITWGKKCLAYQDRTTTRIACCHAILASAYHQLAQTKEARMELASAKALIEPKFPRGLEKNLAENQGGFWQDWIEAWLLLKEAVFEIEGQVPSPQRPISSAQD